MADVHQGINVTAAAAPEASPGTQAAQPGSPPAAGAVMSGTAGTKDPKQIMEAVLVKMLAIFEQLANATVLLSAPQVWW